MKRMVDTRCTSLTCGILQYDQFLDESDAPRCPICQSPAEQLWWARPRREMTCWPESEQVVVFENPNPTDRYSKFSFPARNTKPCPPGWIKHTARSDRELAKIEALTNTRNESRWFDRGTARGFDSTYRGKPFE